MTLNTEVHWVQCKAQGCLSEALDIQTFPTFSPNLIICKYEGGRSGKYTRCCQVGTPGPVPDKGSWSLLIVNVCPKAETWSFRKAVSVPLFMIPGMGRREMGIVMVGHHPTLCLPVLQKSPSPSPSEFAYCKWSKTGGGSGLGMVLEATAIGSVATIERQIASPSSVCIYSSLVPKSGGLGMRLRSHWWCRTTWSDCNFLVGRVWLEEHSR